MTPETVMQVLTDKPSYELGCHLVNSGCRSVQDKTVHVFSLPLIFLITLFPVYLLIKRVGGLNEKMVLKVPG